MTLESLKRELLSAHQIGQRLHKSLKSTEHLFPLDVDGLKAIDDGEQEKIDALLLRFVSLASAIQDRIARSVLLLEIVAEPRGEAHPQDRGNPSKRWSWPT